MCGYCDILNIDKEVDPPTPFDENDFNRMSNDVWIGAINNQVLPEGIYLKTAKYLKEGIDLAPVVDEILTADLTNNIYIFSGAKTYQQTRAMTAMLADPELQSNFYKFKEAVRPMFTLYNEDYLQAEYQTAKASARMASDWKRIEADADVLPLLQYQTVGDGRVRPTHQALDNIIRPISDPFWKQYYPPNGWRCRCTVIQLSEGQETDLSKFTPPEDVPPLFRMNAGIDGYVFKEKGKDKHPYFDIAKGDKEMAKKNWNLPIPQAPRPAPVVEVPKVFKPAMNIKEVEDRIKEFGIKEVDLNGLKLDLANSVLKTIELENTYSSLSELKSLKVFSSRGADLGRYHINSQEITINKTTFNNYKPIESKSFVDEKNRMQAALNDFKNKHLDNPKYNQTNVNSTISRIERDISKIEDKINKNEKFVPYSIGSMTNNASERIANTITHEIGHLRDYTNKNHIMWNGFGEKPNQEGKIVWKWDSKDIPSQYAKTNKREYFAEWYTQYRTYGETGVPKDLLKVFESFKNK
jgi:SPP1 gp7 family putative phage head morphogenesis protein